MSKNPETNVEIEEFLNEIGQTLKGMISFGVPDEWWDIVEPALREMGKYDNWKLLQVKPKFTELRIYFDVNNDLDIEKTFELRAALNKIVNKACNDIYRYAIHN